MVLCICEDMMKSCDRAFDGCNNCEEVPLAITEHLSEAEVLEHAEYSYIHAAKLLKIKDELSSLANKSDLGTGNKKALTGILNHVDELSDSMMSYGFELNGNLKFNYMTKNGPTAEAE